MRLIRSHSLKSFAICLLSIFASASIQAKTSGGTDGLYAATDNNYRIEVKFVPGKLIVLEPNKTSEYIQRPGTGIYNFTNPTNGISYVLEVAGDKTLKAYKPGSPQDFTELALVRPAAPVKEEGKKVKATAKKEAKSVKVVRIPVQNKNALNPDKEELWGARNIPGVNLEGKYTPEGDAHPFLELGPGGNGVMEMHGAPNPEHVYEIAWWIQANQDGTLVETQHPAATEYMLIVQFKKKMYQGMEFDRLSLAVTKAGRIHVLDRSKPNGKAK